MSDLVVAAAQSASVRGDVEANVAGHLRLVEAAAGAGADLVVFPELSLTGYELDLAGALQIDPDDPRLDPLKDAARAQAIQVLVGAPWRSGLDRPWLGAFLIGPECTLGYAKVHVHESERHAFASGADGCVVTVRGVCTGIAICADTSHETHAAAAAAGGAELYVAGVMKAEAEYPAFAERVRGYAAHHRMAVLAANHAGSTGGDRSAGRSAVWNERGELVTCADSNREALVVARREAGHWSGRVISDPDRAPRRSGSAGRTPTIRHSRESDLDAIWSIVNDAAEAYRGVIPADRWHEPYMPLDELRSEIADGVEFWVAEVDGEPIGVMGIQDRGEVALVRHAYVRTASQGSGVGTRLLRHVEGLTGKPVLIGTWAAATWAIEFYRRNGYTVVEPEEKNRLLRRFWSIPARQIETSVVLADARWTSDRAESGANE